MKHRQNDFAPEASTDERASSPNSGPGTGPAAGDDWPEFPTRAEAVAFWQGIRRGISESGRDRAHPHMPEHFPLDLTRDGAEPGLTSSKLLEPWPYLADDEKSRGLTSYGPVDPPTDPSPAAAPGRADRRDGFTVAAEQLFLRVLADTGVVADACRAVGLSRQAAYERRRSASGRAFALAWDAAILLARGAVADDVMSRSRHGVIDRVYRNGELVAERHRYDNRLTMSVLSRLDRLAAGMGENAPVVRAIAQEFDQFLGLLPDGLDAAAEFIALRFPAQDDTGQIVPVEEPDGPFGVKPASGTEEALLCRLATYEQHGVGMPGEIDIAGLDPREMESWTGEQFARAEAVNLFATLDEHEWPEAARDASADGADGMCKARQLYCLYGGGSKGSAAMGSEREDDFAGCTVWEGETGWMTDFPPPPGFGGYQEGEPGSSGYERALAPEEMPAIEAELAMIREEEEDRLAEQEAARRRFFALDDPSYSPSQRDGEGDHAKHGGGVTDA
ncbi:MAG TPA: hypothetical protein VF603_11285 [Allosphingosinicella sp.]|jgi:hypothetical protein